MPKAPDLEAWVAFGLLSEGAAFCSDDAKGPLSADRLIEIMREEEARG